MNRIPRLSILILFSVMLVSCDLLFSPPDAMDRLQNGSSNSGTPGGGNSNIVTLPVTYNANGTLTSGNAPVDNSNYAIDQIVPITNAGTMAMSGYTFAGWATGTNGVTTSYDNTGTLTFTMGSNNVTLYAIWIPNTMTFASSGNSITITACPTNGALIIPNGVTALGTNICYFATGLTSVVFPSSLISIGNNSFCGASMVTTIICQGVNPPSLGGSTFVFMDSIGANSIHVPSASLESIYQNAWYSGTGWPIGDYTTP
jgi:uncharacterized repeat protein (TIGR02543 family)